MPSEAAMKIVADNMTGEPDPEGVARDIDAAIIEALEEAADIVSKWDDWRWAMKQNNGLYMDTAECMVKAGEDIDKLIAARKAATGDVT